MDPERSSCRHAITGQTLSSIIFEGTLRSSNMARGKSQLNKCGKSSINGGFSIVCSRKRTILKRRGTSHRRAPRATSVWCLEEYGIRLPKKNEPISANASKNGLSLVSRYILGCLLMFGCSAGLQQNRQAPADPAMPETWVFQTGSWQ